MLSQVQQMQNSSENQETVNEINECNTMFKSFKIFKLTTPVCWIEDSRKVDDTLTEKCWLCTYVIVLFCSIFTGVLFWSSAALQ